MFVCICNFVCNSVVFMQSPENERCSAKLFYGNQSFFAPTVCAKRRKDNQTFPFGYRKSSGDTCLSMHWYKISQDTPAQACELSVTIQYNLPFSQKVPFPVKPAGHEQLNDPSRSVQSAKV